jgi:2-polyprenyl-3-methyl-5-hydroxy-6-metoxy-1,4-benzoquinol methylase
LDALAAILVWSRRKKRKDDMTPPNPSRIMQALTAYHVTGATLAAIELDIFTAIASGYDTVEALAVHTQTSTKGMRILCDYMVVCEFLTKDGDRYALTPDSAMFLDRRSPAYFGGVASFLSGRNGMRDAFQDITGAVRKGGTLLNNENGTMSRENPIWDEFARSMKAMMGPAAAAIADVVKASDGRPMKVLDVAAGHGIFGITIAQQNPNAEVFAMDWKSVLEIAYENATQAGVTERWHPISGSAFEEDFGSDYDVILFTNFHHHFDTAKVESLMRKAYEAIKPDGMVVTLEFVPNEDRITPPEQATFSMIMLATTEEGDAYTFSEYEQTFRRAGFSRNELIRPKGQPQSLIVSRK